MSAPVKKSAPAKKAPGPEGGLKAVGGAGADPATQHGTGRPNDGDPRRRRHRLAAATSTTWTIDARSWSDVVVGELAVDPAVTADVVVDVESEEVVLTVGKKRTLDDVDESTFEPVEVAKLEDELVEDEGFTLSEADDADEPEQQVMAAGATADPVKDYLKQIGKVALLNAEQEVELAKRIEAGLFADEKINDDNVKIKASQARGLRAGSPRTAGGRRTTCSRPTSAWWSRWPSATPAAGCCSWT